ncbi:hypothetical protein CBM2637_A100016 [Cupriavidus taiwanensis]|nr:hypothetical protein CBM2637_A100016 [Cupriavidus taiwanensis]
MGSHASMSCRHAFRRQPEGIAHQRLVFAIGCLGAIAQARGEHRQRSLCLRSAGGLALGHGFAHHRIEFAADVGTIEGADRKGRDAFQVEIDQRFVV